MPVSAELAVSAVPGTDKPHSGEIMKKCIIAILLAMPMAMAGGVWASDGAAEPAPAPGLAVTEALPSVTGLWRMSDTETVCFVAGGTLRFVGPGWRQNGNYSCTAMHCTVTLLAVPNQPASQNQWNLWLSGCLLYTSRCV